MRTVRPSPLRWAAAAAAAAVLLAAAAAAVPPAEAPASPKVAEDPAPEESVDVAEEMRGICRRLRESDQIYYGERPMEGLGERLGAGVADPAERVRVLALYGQELLQNGRPEEAAETFSEAIALIEEEFPGRKEKLVLLLQLGLAHLQAAEDTNCVLSHGVGSCILPLRGEAVHRDKSDARAAAAAFEALLAEQPKNIKAVWLLNLARMASGDYPEGVPEGARLPSDVFVQEAPFPPWRDRAPELGVDVVDLAGGAVMDDFDGDGLLDLVTSTADPCDHLKAFRNDGTGGFEEVTEAWGLDEQLGGLNMIHGDYDDDGRLDLLVLRGAWLFGHGKIRNSLLRNELGEAPGDAGRFVDVSRRAGVAFPARPTQTAAFGDYDGDGDLDLYVGNESNQNEDHPGQLFRNEGDGTFTDVAAEAGVENLRYAKGVAWGDYDGDRDPDLYVSNHGPNRLYRNDGKGRFVDVAPELDVTGPEKRSFATWFFDFDNDGDLDLFVADFGVPTHYVAASYFGIDVPRGNPVIYENDGEGGFRDASAELGLTRPSAPMGANYGDLDNDGWLDIYLGTGDPFFESLIPNQMLLNKQGRRYRDVSFAGGFAHLQKGHGVAFGDLDNDGDQDLFHQLGGFYPGDDFANVLFENPGNDHHWVTLVLEGRKANHFGVGARLEVRLDAGEGEERSVHRLVDSGGSFGGSSLAQELGLGDAEGIVEVVVRWPGSGTVDRYRGVEMDRAYLLVEGAAQLEPLERSELRLGGTSPASSAAEAEPPEGSL